MPVHTKSLVWGDIDGIGNAGGIYMLMCPPGLYAGTAGTIPGLCPGLVASVTLPGPVPGFNASDCA